MATEATVQVLDDAIDVAGVSTVTSTRTVAKPRQGTVYNPTSFAAGVPVWFHRRQDGRYMALFRTWWDAATSAYNNGPQVFSVHTSHTTPAYLTIDPTTGFTEGPFPLTGMSVLNSAVSLNDYLFTLGTRDGKGWVQHWRVARSGQLVLEGEEPVPMDFSLGLFVDGNYLWVFGADGGGKLARIRKNWGRIGFNSDAQNQWQVEGERNSWYTDFDEGESLPGNLPADGPCSLAKYRDRYFLVATEHVSGAYIAKIYSKRAIDPTWKPTGDVGLALGADAVYLGGTAYVQPQLAARREMLPDGTNAGFPYLTSALVTIGTDQGILTEWGVLSV